MDASPLDRASAFGVTGVAFVYCVSLGDSAAAASLGAALDALSLADSSAGPSLGAASGTPSLLDVSELCGDVDGPCWEFVLSAAEASACFTP